MIETLENLLSPHLDEDTVQYISSLLEDDAGDDDAREAVEALISGSVEDETTAEDLVNQLWSELNESLGGGGGNSSGKNQA